jgi:hypothetical protein
MAVIRLYQIRCDGCSRYGELASANAEARKAAADTIRRVRIGEYIAEGRTPDPTSMYRRDHTVKVNRDLCRDCRDNRLALIQAQSDANEARYGYERVQPAAAK